jgi:hypothetical protein
LANIFIIRKFVKCSFVMVGRAGLGPATSAA